MKVATNERAKENKITGKQVTFFLSNSAAVNGALATIRSVIDQAQELPLQARTDQEVETAIAKLKTDS